MKIRSAFTMIELIFVIVVIGILAKFGVEFIARAYESFIFSSTNNALQSKTASAVEFIANRLQYRIKDSVVVRETNSSLITPIASIDNTKDYVVLEWISVSIDSFRGIYNPLINRNDPSWSGIIDLDNSTANILVSPGTNTTEVNTFINNLSDGNSSVDDAALYFIGSNSDINGFGWDGALTNQNGVMHPIQQVTGNPNQFSSSLGVNFSGVDIFEYYQLAWTANAIILNTTNNNLYLHTNYQPWQGESLTNATIQVLLMEDVATFEAMAIGSIIKIKVCGKTDLIEGYSLCKEKTVF